MTQTLLVGAKQIVTCRGPARARRGAEMSELEVLSDAAVVVDGDTIEAVGPRRDLTNRYPDAEHREVSGIIFPGFVDGHTHAVFGAARLDDHERRARGIGYKEIAAAGGGILSSVRDVRRRTGSELQALLEKRLQTLLAHGTTTVEVKSGYGLTVEDEIKQLQAIRDVTYVAPRTVATFLGAHEVPLDYREKPDEYVDLVINEMLPVVQSGNLARFCDVFCEPGVFSPSQSERVLRAARDLGLGLKIHADELDGSGGAELAAEIGAVSADHLAAISDEGIKRLAESQTVAVLLPGTMMFLGRSGRAPARGLIDQGAAVALATDFNPGSSPGVSLPLMTTMGVSQLRMLPAEAVMAVTVNGAAAVGAADRVGQIDAGFKADFAIVAARDWRELPYWFGANLVTEVWVDGSPCPLRPASLNY